MSETVKFPDAISGIALAPGQVVNGTTGDLELASWNGEHHSANGAVNYHIDFGWYEDQRSRLAAHARQVAKTSEALAMAWYKVIRRSLNDLPIQAGGRNLMNPDYAANLRGIATALGLAPRTLSSYRTAVSRTHDEQEFRKLLAAAGSWAAVVFSLKMSPAYRANVGLDEEHDPRGDYRGVTRFGVRTRCVIQIPTETTDFLMDNGLERSDVTAVIVSYLRQPKVQRELLKLFRASTEQTA